MRAFNVKLCGLLVIPTSLFILPACHNHAGNDNATDESNQDIIKKEVILSPETQDLLNRFPTPFEVNLMLRDAGAPYIFSLTNPPANINRYFIEKTKAINLGIYSTDLAYSSTYQRISETDKFLYCTGKLAGDLGISGVYDKTLLGKVDMYKDNRDSLVALVKRFFGETSDFLRRNNRNQVAILVATGTFVEGLYITSSLCQLATDNSRIAANIFRQKESLAKLLRILGEYGTDSNIKPVADELAKLKPIFTDYGLGSGKSILPRKAAGIVEIAVRVRSSMIK
ncbi:MAG: hypothetical protein NTY96_06115 [Bacteroidetes bacterium]|nr:hypothetical protein [Bacteroidota bacterium]